MGKDAWIKILIAGNGFVLLAFGMGQLLIKGKKAVNYWSFAFFTYAAATFLLTAAFSSGLYADAHALVWINFPIISTTGPLFFFYFSRLTDPDYRFAWKDQWLFAPPIIFLIAAPILNPAGGFRYHPIGWKISYVSVLWVLLCCALFFARALARAREGRPGEGRRLRFLMKIAFGLIVWAALFFVSARTRGAVRLPMVLAATFLLLAVYFYHLRHPEILAPGHEAALPAAHGRSKVAGLDLKATVDRLTRTMEEGKPYLKDDLSLPALAAELGLSPHQLSEILNKEMGTTFKAYINRHRVREAQRILRERPEATVLEIALDCGFRSKSAFNKLFQEETGMTPTVYRRGEGGSPPRAPRAT